MAGTSLLALIDDIATTLDDVAVMTKVAAKKTAGVLGDDLALNAKQVTGVNADRELPVVWAVAKGSTLNKVILIPLALLISQFAGFLVTPLLMLGGAFLCFEGFEKVLEKVLHLLGRAHAPDKTSAVGAVQDVHAYEREKIKGAIRTDFILSAEIIVITLGTVAHTAFTNQVLVLISISLAMTIGVYGLVAGIVKIDDLGLWLIGNMPSAAGFGRALVGLMPYLMKTLGVLGTVAMFLVGGGILTHGVPQLHHLQQTFGSGGAIALDFAVGMTAGAFIVAIFTLAKSFKKKPAA